VETRTRTAGRVHGGRDLWAGGWFYDKILDVSASNGLIRGLRGY